MSWSVNCAAPEGKGRAERGQGLEGGSVRSESGKCSQKGPEVRNFIKVRGPEGVCETRVP